MLKIDELNLFFKYYIIILMLHEFLDILAAMVKLPSYSSYYNKMNVIRGKLRIYKIFIPYRYTNLLKIMSGCLSPRYVN
jgi:hypothetical protein